MKTGEQGGGEKVYHDRHSSTTTPPPTTPLRPILLSLHVYRSAHRPPGTRLRARTPLSRRHRRVRRPRRCRSSTCACAGAARRRWRRTQQRARRRRRRRPPLQHASTAAHPLRPILPRPGRARRRRSRIHGGERRCRCRRLRPCRTLDVRLNSPPELARRHRRRQRRPPVPQRRLQCGARTHEPAHRTQQRRRQQRRLRRRRQTPRSAHGQGRGGGGGLRRSRRCGRVPEGQDTEALAPFARFCRRRRRRRRRQKIPRAVRQQDRHGEVPQSRHKAKDVFEAAAPVGASTSSTSAVRRPPRIEAHRNTQLVVPCVPEANSVPVHCIDADRHRRRCRRRRQLADRRRRRGGGGAAAAATRKGEGYDVGSRRPQRHRRLHRQRKHAAVRRAPRAPPPQPHAACPRLCLPLRRRRRKRRRAHAAAAREHRHGAQHPAAPVGPEVHRRRRIRSGRSVPAQQPPRVGKVPHRERRLLAGPPDQPPRPARQRQRVQHAVDGVEHLDASRGGCGGVVVPPSPPPPPPLTLRRCGGGGGVGGCDGGRRRAAVRVVGVGDGRHVLHVWEGETPHRKPQGVGRGTVCVYARKGRRGNLQVHFAKLSCQRVESPVVFFCSAFVRRY